MPYAVYLILFFPFLGFVLNALLPLNNRVVSLVGPGSVLLAFVSAAYSFNWLHGRPDTPLGRSYDAVFTRWALAGPFHLNVGFLLDPLSSLMTLIITGVGFLILVYSTGYMRGEDGYRRFFAQMDLFILAMLILVLADNYIWLLIGWAGVGLTSYLLIGYYFLRPSAVAAARKAFVMNVIGDWGMMIAIFMMFVLFGGVDFNTVFTKVHVQPYDGLIPTVLALFLLVGAVAKSAQIPLYTWLPDAMEGPTPVSALIHAATMVTAGVYLIARSYPIYQQSPFALHVVAFIGCAGVVFAATMGLANNDIKRVLAYSTMSQIAYMFCGVGVAVYSAGMFHLLEHAFFKALLFMGAGAVMHALGDELDIQKMGGLRHKLPFVYWTFLVGVLAIIGTPLFSGFFSKEDVIGAVFGRAQSGDGWDWLVWALLVIGAGLTAIYMFRLFFLVFHGDPRDRELYDHAHGPGWSMKAPMLVLSVLAVIGGYIAFPGQYNLLDAFLSPVFARWPHNGPAIVAQPFSLASMLATLLLTLVGFLVAYAIYYRRNPAPQRVGSLAPAVYRLLYHRYYVDEIYDAAFVWTTRTFYRLTDRFFEEDTLDNIVDGFGVVTRLAGGWLRGAQTGFVRNYALGILFGAVLIVGYYVIGGR
ncbi:MAG TPA: NADH-quinone oxidoreductase subunit L [Chloroflexota bacterium]|nr:NADH-quinone oxidoreductase subunit L [Chloroflexota bacterium]